MSARVNVLRFYFSGGGLAREELKVLRFRTSIIGGMKHSCGHNLSDPLLSLSTWGNDTCLEAAAFSSPKTATDDNQVSVALGKDRLRLSDNGFVFMLHDRPFQIISCSVNVVVLIV